MALVEPMLHVTLVFSPEAGAAQELSLQLTQPATAHDAVRTSGVRAPYTALGVWGVVCQPDHVLREGDRVELYRSLQVDPKEARRRRHSQERDKKPK
jgi:uncharacterized protein